MSKPQLTRELIAQSDFVKLWSQPEFRRFLFTILDTCGMFTGNFHPEARIHAAREGRRGLGLDILRTAEQYAGQEALSLILADEHKTLTEIPHAKLKPHQYDERDDEDGSNPDLRNPGTGLQFLEYPD